MNERTRYIGSLIRQHIKKVDRNAQIILYGSRARGEEREGSDWDILVLTDQPVSIQEERNFRNHLYDLELEVGEPFSIFVYSKEEWNKNCIYHLFICSSIKKVLGYDTKSAYSSLNQYEE